MYYYEHLSVITDVKKFMVKNIIENRIISTLDERFVANNVDEGSVFITKGLPWKVVSIDENVVSVEPSMEVEAAIPDWVGEDIPVSYDTARGFLDAISGKADAIMPGYFWLSRLALLDIMLVFFFTLSLFFFYRWLKSHQNRMLVFSGLALGLGFLTKYQVLAAGAVMIVSLAVFRVGTT